MRTDGQTLRGNEMDMGKVKELGQEDLLEGEDFSWRSRSWSWPATWESFWPRLSRLTSSRD